MAVLGVGIDIVPIPDPSPSAQKQAGQRAARNAATKATRTLGLSASDFDAITGEDGAPVLACAKAAACRFHVSISHEAGCAIALVIAETIESG